MLKMNAYKKKLHYKNHKIFHSKTDSFDVTFNIFQKLVHAYCIAIPCEQFYVNRKLICFRTLT